MNDLTGTKQSPTTVVGSGSFRDLSRIFSDHEKLVLDLQSTNAALTKRVGQLEASHISWQDMQSRLAALESMSTPQQQSMQQELCPTTMRKLELRILELEKVNASFGDVGVGEHIRRLEELMEGERRARRTQVEGLKKDIKSLRNDGAVLSSENDGLRERLNKLIKGQVRDPRD